MRSFALALAPALTIVGCISPRLVDEQPDPSTGWPTFLFQKDSGWCQRGDGPWAVWMRNDTDDHASGLTLSRDGTLSFFSTPSENAGLAGLSPEETAAWLDEAGFARPDLDLNALEAMRDLVPDRELAPFCMRLARDGPFLPEHDERTECEDHKRIEFVVSTPMGVRHGTATCGGKTPELQSFLRSVEDLREGARSRLAIHAA